MKGKKSDRFLSHTLSEEFELQAAKNPEKIAIRYQAKILTYQELNDLANQLAHYLKKQNLGPKSFVSICLSPGLESIIGILGILKAGATYVPIDPAYPPQRIEHILKDSGAQLLLTHESISDRFKAFKTKLINLNLDSSDWKEIQKFPKNNITQSANSKNLAYIIYTSGSTGTPKGVMIEHQHVLNLFKATDSLFDFTQIDIWTLFHSIAFDFSVWEIWGALLYGGELIIVPYEITRSAEDFYHLLKKHKVTVLNQTPMAFKELINIDEFFKSQLIEEDKPFHLRYVIFGGEALNLQNLKPWFDRYGDREPKLINMYGITEITVHATFRPISITDLLSPGSHSPIGQMLPHLRGYILNEKLQPVANDEIGELYISGTSVARGYLNRPELTAERFITLPFAQGKIYKSGDLVKKANGELQYIGRADTQVKIRGFRIEIGEIESILLMDKHINQAVVTVREDEPGNKYLVAYVVIKKIKHSAQTFKITLFKFLESKLPPYMVPSYIVILKKIPMTPHGKVDYRALPKPEPEQLIIHEKYTPPRTVTEKTIATIWKEVLKLPRIDIHDNFFKLGGHSLLATRVMLRLSDELKLHLKFHWIFEFPTIKQLSKTIDHARKDQQHHEHPKVNKQLLGKFIPLAYEQEGIWLIEQLENLGAAYNVMFGYKIYGFVNTQILESSLNSILFRHEVFRTIFIEQTNGPIQKVKKEHEIKLDIINLEKLNHKTRLKKLQSILKEEARIPFDLSKPPLLRAILIKLEEEKSLLFISVHHIIYDAWSIPIFLRELEYFYKMKISHTPIDLAELPIQYSDFSVWQRKWLQGSRLDELVAFWKIQLEGCNPLLELPLDKPRPTYNKNQGDEYHFHIPNSVIRDVNNISYEINSNFLGVVLAVFSILMNRYCGQDDIVIGIPVANRQYRGIEELIGFFTNTLPLRFQFKEKQSVREWLEKVRAILLLAYRHQELPFNKLVEILQPQHEKNYNPLYQVLVVAFDGEAELLHLSGTQSKIVHIKTESSKFDLSFFIRKKNNGAHAWFEYNTHLFKRDTIKRMAGHFRELLRNFSKSPESNLVDLNFMSEREHHQVLVEWNATQASYPENKGIHELFEEQVIKNPNKKAVVFEKNSLTYFELNQQANLLAFELQKLGVNHNSAVAICAEPAIEIIIAALAILKSNAAYLPLDPSLPEARLNDIVQDSSVKVILTQSNLLERLSQLPATLHVLSEKPKKLNTSEGVNLNLPSHPDNTAYVIYTSGTTGKPKGIALSHKTLTNLISWQAKQSSGIHNVAMSVALFSTFSFDVATQAIFFSLGMGHTLSIIPKEKRIDPFALLNFLYENKINLTFIPPAVLQNLAQSFEVEHITLNSLQEIIVAGDALHITSVVRDFFLAHPQCRLTNQYGPSETHVVTSKTLIGDAKDWPNLPSIGRPIDNAKVYILDNYLNPVPIGISGELFLGGVMLAKEYIGQPELTKTKFIPNPFQQNENSRLYRTGDLVRYYEDGNLEFITRIDQQVKIRGYRIELNEIEMRIKSIESIENAAVMVNKDSLEDTKLVAYVVTKDQKSLNSAEIISQLEKYLPNYMIPVHYVNLDKMPISVNGKIDKKLLPKIDLTETQSQVEYVPPRNELEEKLCYYWSELLNIKKISVFDNFFDLGGHSLLATQLILKIRLELKTLISIANFFNQPTIANLANLIGMPNKKQATGSESALIEKDIRLDPKILPIKKPLLPSKQSKAILLTGANGFLGTYLLNELLQNTKADIYCLVRAENSIQAEQRLTASLEKFHFENWVANPRIIPIPGDLSKPNLGIASDYFKELTKKIDSIYHNGAAVHHIYDYATLRASNVFSTIDLIKFASQGRPKRIHYISTIAAAWRKNKKGFLVEKFPSPNSRHYTGGGYVISKWVSEMLLAQASERGFAVTIYRPAYITGDSVTGIFTVANTHLALFIKSCIQLEYAPKNWGKLDILPVDFVAKAIIALSLEDKNAGQVYHLNNPKLVRWNTVFTWINKAGYPLHLLPHNYWLDYLSKIDSRNALYPLLSLYLTQDPKGEQEEACVISSFTQKSLKKLSLSYPKINQKLLNIYLKYLHDWLEKDA